MTFRPSTLLIIIAALSLLLNFSAVAGESFHIPAYCPAELLQIQVKNLTKSPQRLWTQVRTKEALLEQHFDFDASESRTLNAQIFLDKSQGFAIKTSQSGALQIRARCGDEAEIPLSEEVSSQSIHYLPFGVLTVKLFVMNLSWQEQPVLVSAYSSQGNLLATRSFSLDKDYDTSTLKWTVPPQTSRLEVRGEGRLHSWAFFSFGAGESFSPPISVLEKIYPDLNKKYFLISTRDQKPEDSYVISLTDPEQIRIAQGQIHGVGFQKIIVARIKEGHGGFNRNLRRPDKATYSWSVSDVDAFSDFAHISCDGSPELVEERLPQYLNEGGRICFWRYRVIRELTAPEVGAGSL